MNKKMIGGIVAVIIIAAALYYAYTNKMLPF